MNTLDRSKVIRVLLVEDDEGDRFLLQELLGQIIDHEYDLEICTNLQCFFQKVDETEIDLILLDLGLPDSQGLETFYTVHKKIKQIPIIVLTGLNDSHTSNKVVREGAQDFLIKGTINSGSLMRSINYAIERKKTELELQHLYEDLKRSEEKLIQTEKMTAVGIMTAGVAHELNNPMMGILNYIGYALKHTDKTTKTYQVLQDAKKETERCIDIVKQLLTFTYKPHESNEKLTYQECVIVMQSVLSLIKYRLDTNNIIVTTHIEEKFPDEKIFPSNVQQVFLNILTNAIDALAQVEKKQKKIEIFCTYNKDDIKISIRDNGPGIPEQVLAKIYDPFYTTKEIGKGTGLGLSLTRNIITSHGGSINCITDDEGTTFELSFPFKSME